MPRPIFLSMESTNHHGSLGATARYGSSMNHDAKPDTSPITDEDRAKLLALIRDAAHLRISDPEDRWVLALDARLRQLAEATLDTLNDYREHMLRHDGPGFPVDLERECQAILEGAP